MFENLDKMIDFLGRQTTKIDLRSDKNTNRSIIMEDINNVFKELLSEVVPNLISKLNYFILKKTHNSYDI